MAEFKVEQKKQQSSGLDTVSQRKTVLPDQRGKGAQARALTDNRTAQLASDPSPKANNTGLPNQLKAGIESLSGISMDHVKVHYNSSQPAQLNAHAYVQGSNIHLASGQEKHLPHEAWHVVQQAQGRVKPTIQMKAGVGVNDDVGLEAEADVMGTRALGVGGAQVNKPGTSEARELPPSGAMQRRRNSREALQPAAMSGESIQRMKGLELAKSGDEKTAEKNRKRNVAMIQHAFVHLPKRVQNFLLRILSQSEPSAGHELVRVHQPDPIDSILTLNPGVIANVLIGLRLLPDTVPLPKEYMGMQKLFVSLATTQHGFIKDSHALMPPESIAARGVNTAHGVEHVTNSCYAASILQLLAANNYYRRLFNPAVNRLRPKSRGSLLQNAVFPALATLTSNGTVRANYMRLLLQVLDHFGFLQGGAQAIAQQQDAAQVLVRMLQWVMPVADTLVTREKRVYDHPQAENEPQIEANHILQLTAVGHATLEQALAAYFVTNERRADAHNPHTRTLRMVSYPQVLTIGMMRQSEADQVDMPQAFTIPASITHNGAAGPRYRLQAFVVRNTFSHLSGGHYVTVLQNAHQQWYEADDMGAPKPHEHGVMSPHLQSIDVDSHTLADHPAPAYALATMYTYVRVDDHHAPQARSSFSTVGLLHDPLNTDAIFSKSGGLAEQSRRAHLIEQFRQAGGSAWEVHDLLRKYGHDAEKLEHAVVLLTHSISKGGRRFSEADKAKARKDPSYEGFKLMSNKDLLSGIANYQKELQSKDKALSERVRSGLLQQMLCMELVLKDRQDAERGGDYGQLMSFSNRTGMTVSVFGTASVMKMPKRDTWLKGIVESFLAAPFLVSRRPALQIRISLRPGVTRDIACTYSKLNHISIEMDDYQVERFSIGQALGLLSHEVGVHSLDSTTLTSEQSKAELLDKDSQVTGNHQGQTFVIGSNPKLTKQQQDHLTIGRALLGQKSALPRLRMYEATIISLLQSMPSAQRWDAAAAYCIDIARILVTNDDPTEMGEAGKAKQIKYGLKIATTAANEWTRIKRRYGKDFPVVNSITIWTVQILKALTTLASLLEFIETEVSKSEPKPKH